MARNSKDSNKTEVGISQNILVIRDSDQIKNHFLRPPKW
jgi:hypothetical protein